MIKSQNDFSSGKIDRDQLQAITEAMGAMAKSFEVEKKLHRTKKHDAGFPADIEDIKAQIEKMEIQIFEWKFEQIDEVIKEVENRIDDNQLYSVMITTGVNIADLKNTVNDLLDIKKSAVVILKGNQ